MSIKVYESRADQSTKTNLNINIFKKAIENYDQLREENKDFMNKIDRVEMETKKEDSLRSLITFFDNKNNKLGKAPFEILGVYHNLTHLWSWAWAVHSLAKNATTLSKQLFDYGYNIDRSANVTDYGLNLRAELLNSRFKIKDVAQIDIYISLCLYLSKKRMVYPYVIKNDHDPNDYTVYYLVLLTNELIV
jgi:hypothetical protein